MENGQVVDVLDIAFLEVCGDTEFLTEEMNGIQCFSLRLCDWGNINTTLQCTETDEVSTGVL